MNNRIENLSHISQATIHALFSQARMHTPAPQATTHKEHLKQKQETISQAKCKPINKLNINKQSDPQAIKSNMSLVLCC